jgi:hypothetical protein
MTVQDDEMDVGVWDGFKQRFCLLRLATAFKRWWLRVCQPESGCQHGMPVEGTATLLDRGVCSTL